MVWSERVNNNSTEPGMRLSGWDCWKSGGEGGIRTPGTGVSPYNGLAKGSFLTALTRFQGFTVRLNPLSRTQSVSFGSYCAPLCAPQFQDVQV